MKIVEEIDVISKGNAKDLDIWRKACRDVTQSILLIDWPHGSGSFKLNPSVKHKNGVKLIKNPGINNLRLLGWRTECLPSELAGVKNMGKLDAMLEAEEGRVGFEWETGNISSSHRAINKMLYAMLRRGLIGAILVVPAESMRRYITDRIGNITELREYFPFWSAININFGVFRIVVIEHDELDPNAPFIPKGRDGMFRIVD